MTSRNRDGRHQPGGNTSISRPTALAPIKNGSSNPPIAWHSKATGCATISIVVRWLGCFSSQIEAANALSARPVARMKLRNPVSSGKLNTYSSAQPAPWPPRAFSMRIVARHPPEYSAVASTVDHQPAASTPNGAPISFISTPSPMLSVNTHFHAKYFSSGLLGPAASIAAAPMCPGMSISGGTSTSTNGMHTSSTIRTMPGALSQGSPAIAWLNGVLLNGQNRICIVNQARQGKAGARELATWPGTLARNSALMSSHGAQLSISFGWWFEPNRFLV